MPYAIVITPEELALAESLLAARRAADALGGEHALQYGGTYGAVDKALETCLTLVFEAHAKNGGTAGKAKRWARAIIELTIDSGEGVADAIVYALNHPEHATSVAGTYFDFAAWTVDSDNWEGN